MQDEVREKSVALAITVGKHGGRLTADLLKWAIRRYLAESANPKAPHGKQTVKQLVGQGSGVQNMEITDRNIKSFERVARKYGVDYAVRRVRVQNQPQTPQAGAADRDSPSDTAAEAANTGTHGKWKYIVFFKARDRDALTAAFAEYADSIVHRKKEKPSVRRMLEQFREQVKGKSRIRCGTGTRGRCRFDASLLH